MKKEKGIWGGVFGPIWDFMVRGRLGGGRSDPIPIYAKFCAFELLTANVYY